MFWLCFMAGVVTGMLGLAGLAKWRQIRAGAWTR